MTDDREAALRAQLAARFDADSYDEVRGLWIAHSKAELARDVDGLVATLTDDCVYEIAPGGPRWEGLDGAGSIGPRGSRKHGLPTLAPCACERWE